MTAFGAGTAYKTLDSIQNPTKAYTRMLISGAYLKHFRKILSREGKVELRKSAAITLEETKTYYQRIGLKQGEEFINLAEKSDPVKLAKKARTVIRVEHLKNQLAFAGQNMRYGALVGITVGIGILVYEMKKSDKTPKEIFTLNPNLDSLFAIASSELALKCQ